MPVLCDWYDEAHAIILLRFIDNWTPEESLVSSKILNQLSRQISGRFDIISDLLHAAYTPPTGILWQWQQTTTMFHHEFPNWGVAVYVTTSRVTEAYINEGIQNHSIIQQHGRLARTVEEAVQIIQADRVSRLSALHG